MLVSVGTGAAESLGTTAESPGQNMLSNAAGIPGGLMNTIQIDQDINCRAVGRCTYGAHLDNEIMDMVPREVSDGMTKEQHYAAPKLALSTDLGRRFLYCRYNVDLSANGLAALGFPKVNPASIQKMDAVANIPALTEIGISAGQQVDVAHFGPFI